MDDSTNDESQVQEMVTSIAHRGDPNVTNEDYTKGYWKGLDQWQCQHCPWSTLESEAAMIDHIKIMHRPKTKTIALPLVDARGQVITKEIVIIDEECEP